MNALGNTAVPTSSVFGTPPVGNWAAFGPTTSSAANPFTGEPTARALLGHLIQEWLSFLTISFRSGFFFFGWPTHSGVCFYFYFIFYFLGWPSHSGVFFFLLGHLIQEWPFFFLLGHFIQEWPFFFGWSSHSGVALECRESYHKLKFYF